MDVTNIPQTPDTLAALWKIQKIIFNTLDFEQVVQKIVDSIAIELDFSKLGYRIIVLALVDEKEGVMKRISMSQTPAAEATMGAGKMTFDQIVIPLTAENNLCIRSYKDKEPKVVLDWKDILTPPMTEEEARRLQTISGVKNSIVFPVLDGELCIGVMIFSLEKDVSEMSEDEKNLIQSFTDIVSLAIHDANLYSNLNSTSKKLDEANKKLKELDKLKDEFVSLASHELRTPMTAVKSYTWLVLNNKSGEITPKTREHLEKVYNSTERLIHLVNEMLDISRIEGGRVQLKLEALDLVQLAREVKDEFAPRASEQNLVMEIETDGKISPAAGDRDKIHQVLVNLVGNSFKFTQSGGRVSISVRLKDNMVEVGIEDTGIGIAKEDQERIFQKFGRVEGSLVISKIGGTGLGLYLSKQYIEMHGGKIWFESEPGKGSTFTFSLPLYTGN